MFQLTYGWFDLHITLMKLNMFLIGLQKNPSLHFDQIIINKKEKESSFSAKSLSK